MAISNYYSVCRYLQRLIQAEATGNGNIIMLRLALTSWRWMLDVVVVCWSTTRIAGRLSVCCCCCWWVLRLMAPSTSVSGSITRSPTYSESTIKKTKRPLLSAILSSNIHRLLELQFRTVLSSCLILGFLDESQLETSISFVRRKLWIRLYTVCAYVCVYSAPIQLRRRDEFNNRSIQTQLKRQEPAHRGTHHHRGRWNHI